MHSMFSWHPITIIFCILDASQFTHTHTESYSFLVVILSNSLMRVDIVFSIFYNT